MLEQMAIPKKTCFVLFVVLALGLAADLCLAQEAVTITTYYPSPEGIYRNLRLIPGSAFPPCSSAANEGTLYFDTSLHKLYICQRLVLPNGSLGGYGWGGMLWAAQPVNTTNIYAAITGSVGIGTTTPTSPAPNGQCGNLDVNDIYVRSLNNNAGWWISQQTIPHGMMCGYHGTGDCTGSLISCMDTYDPSVSCPPGWATRHITYCGTNNSQGADVCVKM